jgi:4-carboxymuconolactone decarboxylase
MDEAELKQKTRDTARRLFHSLKSGVGFEQWKRFDKGLARDLSMFFTGTLYSREVISQAQRELCAVASLTVLHRSNELRAHIHAALNVGATRQEVAEVIFQQVTYGGMPVVAEGLAVLRRVLEERGDWPARPTPRRDRSGAAAPRGRRRRRAKRAIRTAPPASRRA